MGDDCTIGEEAYLAPDVRVYPSKTVDAGAQVHSSIIWESRGSSRLFGKQGVSGIANVDITAERALDLAMAYGTTLPTGARVTTSRDAHPASRVIKRVLIAGLNSTGVTVRDLRHASSAINRFEVKHGEAEGGIHVRIASWDPESIQIQIFEPPGVDLGERRQKDVERVCRRQDFRRALHNEFGEIQFPDRAPETYTRSLTSCLDTEVIRGRSYRLVVDYSSSPAILVLPRIFGELGVEVLALRAYGDHRAADPPAAGSQVNIPEVRNLVRTMEADMGLIIDPGSERLVLVDERGVELSHEQALLLLVRLVARRSQAGQLIALPATVTNRAEQVAADYPVKIHRTNASGSALASAALHEEVVFAAALGGGYIFPEFLPAFDAAMSLGKLLELLAHGTRSLSEEVALLPESALVHRTVPCPWALKGATMRASTEALQHSMERGGGAVTLDDGVRVICDTAWLQLLPDADEPIFHVYAEGALREDSEKLANSLAGLVRAVIHRHSR